jgi:hypothetical protein
MMRGSEGGSGVVRLAVGKAASLSPGASKAVALERLYRLVDDLVSAKETKKRRPASRH